MMIAQMGGNGNVEAGLAGMMLVFVCGFVIVALVVLILFLLTLQRTLAKCSPQNRTMEPGMVWLNLIPCFNIVWQFVTVNRVADSLKNEFESRGERRDETYGRTLGIIGLVLNIISGFIGRAGEAVERGGNESASMMLSVVGLLVAIPALILFIVYWVKIVGYGRELDEAGYEDDDRPRRKLRDDVYDDEDDRDRYDR